MVGGFGGHHVMMFLVVSLCVIPWCNCTCTMYICHLCVLSHGFYGFHAQFWLRQFVARLRQVPLHQETSADLEASWNTWCGLRRSQRQDGPGNADRVLRARSQGLVWCLSTLRLKMIWKSSENHGHRLFNRHQPRTWFMSSNDGLKLFLWDDALKS